MYIYSSKSGKRDVGSPRSVQRIDTGFITIVSDDLPCVQFERRHIEGKGETYEYQSCASTNDRSPRESYAPGAPSNVVRIVIDAGGQRVMFDSMQMATPCSSWITYEVSLVRSIALRTRIDPGSALL